MAERHPYIPFHGLKEFKTLETLNSHILHSLNVSQIKIVLPGDFDVTRLHDPELLVPVYDILVGDANFNYILQQAAQVIEHVKDRINKLNKKPEPADKLLIYKKLHRSLTKSHKYFNSMNPIRYMSNCKWMISYSKYVNGKHQPVEIVYPNSKMDLHAEHWNIIESNFIIRRQLVEELLYLVTTEIETINESLVANQYKWEGENQYEIYELLLAIIASNRVKFIKGDVHTFSYEFFKMLGLQPADIPYLRGKVMDRKNRAIFIPKLEKYLQEYGIPRKKVKRS
jgi:hypothetical protein